VQYLDVMDIRALTLAECDPALPWYIRANEWDWIEDAHRLHRRFGLTPVGYMKEMLRPLAQPVDVAPVAGIEIVPWDRELDEGARIATNEAFRDHWGRLRSTPSPTDTVSKARALASTFPFSPWPGMRWPGFASTPCTPTTRRSPGVERDGS